MKTAPEDPRPDQTVHSAAPKRITLMRDITPPPIAVFILFTKMSPLAAVKALADQRWSVQLHESLYGYPIVESVHVWALCLFVGLTVVLDLRLTGLTFRTVPVSEVVRRILPWQVAGFIGW